MEDLDLSKIKVSKRDCGFHIQEKRDYTQILQFLTSVFVSKEDAEQLRDWLTEALKPRYTVEKEQDQYLVLDNETPKNDWGNEQVATFYNHKSIDAKTEAHKLCKTLNEGRD